ncbi:MAG TPA: S8 family serine peptidase, partial [Pseudonocardiaceae bacterium]|nr:S8 family serine peptidase [Pseudonocardiaceae bacterium]
MVAVAAPAVAAPRPAVNKPTVVYRNLRLVDCDTATVFSNGLAEVFRPGTAATEYRMVPLVPSGAAGVLPAAPRVAFDLAKAPAVPYAHDQVEVVLAAGVNATSARRELPATAVAPGAPTPDYTTNATLNQQLAGIGVTSMDQVFGGMTPAGDTGVDLSRVYTMHVTHASVPAALAALSASPAVAYAEPDWIASPLNTTPVPMPATGRAAIHPAVTTSQALPTNVGLQSSAQSLLNSTATDWVPAYQGLESAYHQLPGTGEVVTDVSLGDLTSAGVPGDDPCAPFVAAFGPTTVIQGGQRFLDLPSMPLIPTWTADAKARLDPTGETCDVDPFDTEIDLDFAMMAPLPHDLQRPDEPGSGLTDLLGIAPGAAYRLVVPSDPTGSISSVDAALLAAARQTPRPDVITASLGFGLDSEGFPSRYLEDDPVTEALIARLTHQFGITVAVSANDGLRTPTDAAVGPAGGSVATDVACSARQATDLDDVDFSTAPSLDVDSGAIDVGGVTLDDIASAPPQDPANAALADQQAFPEVRWNGAADFSSGFGARVNLSAPGDNVLGFEHSPGGAADAVDVVNTGGTSASAQEVGAAAAVVLQAARLTGDRSVTTPPALRSYLERTARPVPGVPQADRPLNV